MQLKSGLTLLIGMVVVLCGCATRETPAPIVNVTRAPQYADEPVSRVRRNVNNDNDDSPTKLGSLDNNNHKSAQSSAKNAPATETKSVAAASSTNEWIQPLAGASVNRPFSERSKGIDYTGRLGQDVYAVNNGKVVYSGNGLKGYGNLVIIKHDKNYLSAYANNQANLVKDGDSVTRGQKIATMGKDAAGKPLLHFEIRQNGKPIDPTNLIK